MNFWYCNFHILDSQMLAKYLLPATILKIVSYLVLSLTATWASQAAKQPMADPSSCKGQNKVRDNFQNCGRKVQCILSIVCLQASITLMLLCKLYIFCKKVSTILSNCVHFLHKKANLHKKFTFFL